MTLSPENVLRFEELARCTPAQNHKICWRQNKRWIAEKLAFFPKTELLPVSLLSQSSIRSIAYMDLDWGEGGIPKGAGLLQAASNNSLNIANIFCWKRFLKVSFLSVAVFNALSRACYRYGRYIPQQFSTLCWGTAFQTRRWIHHNAPGNEASHGLQSKLREHRAR